MLLVLRIPADETRRLRSVAGHPNPLAKGLTSLYEKRIGTTKKARDALTLQIFTTFVIGSDKILVAEAFAQWTQTLR